MSVSFVHVQIVSLLPLSSSLLKRVTAKIIVWSIGALTDNKILGRIAIGPGWSDQRSSSSDDKLKEQNDYYGIVGFDL